MKFSTHNLFSIFLYLFFFVSISPFIERLDALGKPNLSIVRMGIAIFLLIIMVPFYFKRGLIVNKKGIVITGVLFIYIGYILLSAVLFKEDFNQITFYIVYIHLVFFGYIAIFQNNLDRFERLLTIVCFIAIVVGTVMMIAGPDKIKAMGIGAIEGKWGQFTTTDAQKASLDFSLLFRSFSIFVDHQAFSVFLQLCAFFYRFLYEIKKEKKYIWAIFVLFLANTLTFSSTGYVAILIILLTLIKLRYAAIILSILVFFGIYLYALFPQIALLLFHQDSLEYRIIYMQRALEQIQWLPSLHEMWRADFSADCYFLWMSFKYGGIYAFLQVLLLLAIVALLAGRKMLGGSVFLLVCLFLINLMTNAACFSTPNNILLPVLFGMVVSYSLHLYQKNPY